MICPIPDTTDRRGHEQSDHVRLDVLTAAVQEIGRALAPAQAAAVAEALSTRIATMTAGALSEAQDEAAVGEQVPLLAALGRINAPGEGHNPATR